jgi:hypothetical protein
MGKIWTKRGKNMDKIWKKIWAKYGQSMDIILITPCRQIDSAYSHETPASLTTVCGQLFFNVSLTVHLGTVLVNNPCKFDFGRSVHHHTIQIN